MGVSSNVTVLVDNILDVADTTPPNVSIGSPTDGDTVSGTVSIQVNASDNVAVTGLSIFIDNSLACSSANTGALSCSWNTRKASSGGHTIKATATDAAGNSRATSVSVTIGNSTSGKGNNGKGFGRK